MRQFLKDWWMALVMIPVVLGPWLWWRSRVASSLTLQEPLNPGTYGDWFGSLNALFSGLAFGGIIVTLHLQMRELREQRAALLGQEEQLKLAARAQADQVKLMNEGARLAVLPILIERAISHAEGACNLFLGRGVVGVLSHEELEKTIGAQKAVLASARSSRSSDVEARVRCVLALEGLQSLYAEIIEIHAATKRRQVEAPEKKSP